MVTVRVYDVYNNTHEWKVNDKDKAREYAKRIIVEGLWYKDGEEEIFLPVHRIIKVKLIPDTIPHPTYPKPSHTTILDIP